MDISTSKYSRATPHIVSLAYSLYIHPLTSTAELAPSYELKCQTVVYPSKGLFFLRTQLKSLSLQKVIVPILANTEDTLSRPLRDFKVYQRHSLCI